MANVYVYSGAAGAGTGADWANAYTTLAAAFTAKAAGDDFWVAQDHSEQAAAANTLLCPGTATSPCRVICVNRAGSVPPVAADLATTAVIGTTGANNMTFTASASANYFYCYGIIWKVGSGSSTAVENIFTARTIFENCSFQLNTTAAGGAFIFGTSTGNFDTTLINCTFVFGAVGQDINPRVGRFKMIGGSIAATGTAPNAAFSTTSGSPAPMYVILDGVDLTGLSTKILVGAWPEVNNFQAINCKLPASITLASTPTNTGAINDFIICDSGTGNTRHERYLYGGPVTSDTAVYRSGGASDGTTPISWKVVTNANARSLVPVECWQIAQWNGSTGSKTVTIELVNDGSTLTDAEVWAEFEYLGSSATPIATMISTAPATILTAASNLATSSATWTGTGGFSSPVKQYLTATFTVNMAGYIRATVKVAKASKTIYIDPVLTVS